MVGKDILVIQERPELDVYMTDSGFIGIRQKVRGEECMVLFTPDEAELVAKSLQTAVKKMHEKHTEAR